MTNDQSYRQRTPAEVLAELSAKRDPRPSLSSEYVEATSPMEKRVAAFWKEVLGLETVGKEDNFFELGGDSLQMTRVMSRVREELGVELTFDDFFTNESVASFASMLEGRRSAEASSDGSFAPDHEVKASKEAIAKEGSGS